MCFGVFWDVLWACLGKCVGGVRGCLGHVLEGIWDCIFSSFVYLIKLLLKDPNSIQHGILRLDED